MGSHADRQRFIPFGKSDVLEMLVAHASLADADRPRLRAVASLLSRIFQVDFDEKIEALKAHYAPFDPDLDVRRWKEPTAAETLEHERLLVEKLQTLLNDANYEPLSAADLAHALAEESLFNVSLFIDFDDFVEHVIYTRGITVKRATVKKHFFWKDEIDVPTFERVAILVRFKPKAYFDGKERKALAFEPGSMMLKLFKDVPKADLEMLFPNTQVRMNTKDKLLLGVPGVIGGVVVLVKTGASIVGAALIVWLLAEAEVERTPPRYPQPHQMALIIGALTAVLALFGYLFRQYGAYKNRKLAFMKALTDNLYFRNLDNNAGVFHRVGDAAAEEEWKEAILGYFFLLHAGAPQTAEQIDDAVEAWFEKTHETRIDFEIADAIRKLVDLRLCDVRPGAEPSYDAVPLDEASRRLTARWDGYVRTVG
jgi:Protein of unknown function (DUF3754)